MRIYMAAAMCGTMIISACGSTTPPSDTNNSATNSELNLIGGRPTAALTTNYPVVFTHGLLGFDRKLGFSYLRHIANHLRAQGVDFYVTEVSPAHSVAFRAQQLAAQIDKILATSSAKRVNLIGHSMGGLDCRYLISTLGYGDRVASLTTIATPNQGTALADYGLAVISASIYARIDPILAALSRDFSEQDINLHAALESMSKTYVQKTFNPENPDDARVFYQSYAGMAQKEPAGKHKDPSDQIRPLLRKSWEYLHEQEGSNDGLVSVESAKWGNFKGTLHADHFDQLGYRELATSSRDFDHRALFREIVGDLRASGF